MTSQILYHPYLNKEIKYGRRCDYVREISRVEGKSKVFIRCTLMVLSVYLVISIHAKIYLRMHAGN